MCFNILPNGGTLMHSIYTNMDAVDYAYNLASGEEEVEGMERFEMPFTEDYSTDTPLHKAVKSANWRIVERLLTELSNSSINHHSIFVEDLFPKMIEEGISSFDEYLTARWKETEWTKRIDRGNVEVIDECSFAVTTNSLFLKDQKEFEKKISTPDADEIPIQIELFDMPGVFKFEGGETLEIFEALSETKNIEMFSNSAIRAMIEVRWDLVKNATINKLFVPYIFYLVTFMTYASYIYPESNMPNATALMLLIGEGFKYGLIFLSLLFLSNELYQFKENGIYYLYSPWNYIDLGPPLLIMSLIGYDYVYPNNPDTYAIMSLAALMTWLKFLYFMRIFRQFGSLIGMIIEVMADMKVFVCVLLITFLTFGSTFYLISQSNPDDEKFVLTFADGFTYAYRMTLGDWDTSAFGVNNILLVWIFFFLTTLFMLVIMFNLLIAIISDTFERVQEN